MSLRPSASLLSTCSGAMVRHAGSKNHPVRGLRGARGEPRDAAIGLVPARRLQLRQPLNAQQFRVGFVSMMSACSKIAMDDAVAMRLVEGVGDLDPRSLQRLLERVAALFRAARRSVWPSRCGITK